MTVTDPDKSTVEQRPAESWSDAVERAEVHRFRGEIHNVIAERAGRYLAARGETPIEVTVKPEAALPVGHSVLFRYLLEPQHSGAAFRILVKVRREWKNGPFSPLAVSEKTVARSVNEYKILCNAYRFYSALGPDLAVVQPIDYLNDFNALVVAQASGGPLDERVVSDKDGSAVAHLERCGQWLRKFHLELHEPTSSPWDKSSFMTRLEQRLQPLPSHGVSETRVKALKRIVAESAEGQPAQQVPVSVLHGDYKLRHIWANQMGIQVFDFGNSSSGDCYRDVAAYLIELLVLRLWKPWFRTARIDKYCTSFLRGYFGDSPIPSVLRFYVLEYLLKKWNRRLTVWGNNFGIALIHRILGESRLAKAVEEAYLNPWFHSRALDYSMANNHRCIGLGDDCPQNLSQPAEGIGAL